MLLLDNNTNSFIVSNKTKKNIKCHAKMQLQNKNMSA